MGIGEWFSTFCTNIGVKDDGTISMRYKRITQRLNLDFWDTDSEISHSLYVGSYGRNTAISGFSDLDMIMQLPYSVYERYNSYTGNGQSALLQTVKTSIEKTYSTTSIRADGQVITVPFNDGISFEVVPAFLCDDNSAVTLFLNIKASIQLSSAIVIFTVRLSWKWSRALKSTA